MQNARFALVAAVAVAAGCQAPGAGAGVDAAAAADATVRPRPDGCVPITCAELGATCGAPADGCGGTLACGGCAEPKRCTEDLSCACTEATCDARGVECGPIAGCGDGFACGACSDPLACGGRTDAPSCELPLARRLCTDDGWCWENPAPHGYRIRQLAPTDAGRMFAATQEGTVVSFDGARWRYEHGVPGEQLLGVWARSASDVWAVGTGGTVLHFDGDRWTPRAAGASGRLEAVWGADTGEVFVGGSDGLFARDGGAFAPIPLELTDPARVVAIDGLAAADVWVAALERNDARDAHGHGVAFHRGGDGWTRHALSSSASRPTDLWVAPDGAPWLLAAGRGYRFTGGTWSETIIWRREDQFARAIEGLAADDVWAVGAGGLVSHYDGAEWTRVSPEIDGDLHDLRVDATGLRRVAGDGGQFASREADGWRAHQSFIAGRTSDVWVADPGFAIAVGDSTTTCPLLLCTSTDGATLVWDGGRLRRSAGNARAVWGTSRTDIRMVGDAGRVGRWNGTTWWSPHPRPVEADLHGLWGSSRSSYWAVGEGGTILHDDGDGWLEVASGTAADLDAVWGAAADAVWAVGEGGVIRHYDGERWRAQSSPTGADLRAIHGSSATDAWAVGDGGVVLRWDGAGWTEVAGATGADLYAVYAPGPDRAWAAGEGTHMIAWDGAGWRALPAFSVSAFGNITGLHGANGAVWAFGQSGMALRLDGQ